MLTFVQVLKQPEDLDAGLLGGLNLQVSGDGRFLYLTARRDSTVTVFERDPDNGELDYVEQLAEFAGERPGSGYSFNLYGASSMVLLPDSQHMHVTGIQTIFW